MAEIDQLFRMSAEFVLVANQAQMMKDMIEKMAKSNNDKKTTLDTRRFREIGNFDGFEDKWKVWSSKFKDAVKETNVAMFEALKEAKEGTEEIDPEAFDDGELEAATAVYNRLMMLLTGSAFTIHQTVMNENGFEVWRQFTKRYSTTPKPR